MARRNTKLEAEGAEFLVLGHLLTNGIAAYKTYTNMPGYDVLAVSPEMNTSARISVKSRWDCGATGFIIRNFDCDFVVVAKLNCGPRERQPSEFFVIPCDAVREAAKSAKGWGRIEFRKIKDFRSFANRWDLVRESSLGARRTRRTEGAQPVATDNPVAAR